MLKGIWMSERERTWNKLYVLLKMEIFKKEDA